MRTTTVRNNKVVYLYCTHLVEHTYGDGLSENQAFSAIKPIVDASHLPATIDT